MEVKLLHHTPLWVSDKAIGKCWNKPTPDVKYEIMNLERTEVDEVILKPGCNTERIDRVANKNKHASTIEHLNYTFDIDGISRALLQELARHRMASLSVKSTRYTLKELKDEEPFVSLNHSGKMLGISVGAKERALKYIVPTQNEEVRNASIYALENLRVLLSKGVPNDTAKYCLPESYKTSLVLTVNARSLQNFLSLRTSKAALWEIRDLANEIFKQLPEDHRFLFEGSISNG